MHQLSLRTTTTLLTLILRLKLQNTTTYIIQSHSKNPFQKTNKTNTHNHTTNTHPHNC